MSKIDIRPCKNCGSPVKVRIFTKVRSDEVKIIYEECQDCGYDNNQ